MKKIYIKPVSKVILLQRQPQLMVGSAFTRTDGDWGDGSFDYEGGYNGEGR